MKERYKKVPKRKKNEKTYHSSGLNSEGNHEHSEIMKRFWKDIKSTGKVINLE